MNRLLSEIKLIARDVHPVSSQNIKPIYRFFVWIAMIWKYCEEPQFNVWHNSSVNLHFPLAGWGRENRSLTDLWRAMAPPARPAKFNAPVAGRAGQLLPAIREWGQARVGQARPGQAEWRGQNTRYSSDEENMKLYHTLGALDLAGTWMEVRLGSMTDWRLAGQRKRAEFRVKTVSLRRANNSQSTLATAS